MPRIRPALASLACVLCASAGLASNLPFTGLGAVAQPEARANIEILARIMQLPGPRREPGDELEGPGLVVHNAGNNGRPITAELIATSGDGAEQGTRQFRGDVQMFLVSLQGSFSIGEATYDIGKAERGPFTMISAPQITVEPGQEASVNVAAAVQWMSRGADGRFDLITSDDVSEGIQMALTTNLTTGGVKVESFSIEFREIAAREPVEGVELPIGKPVMRRTEVSASLTIPDGFGLLVPLQPLTAGSGQIFVLLSARPVK